MATLDNDDITKLEDLIDSIVHKHMVTEHRREGQKEGTEKKLKRLRLPKEYGLALFSAGLPLLFAGLNLRFSPGMSTDTAFIWGGVVVAIAGLVFMVCSKWLVKPY
jgi:uncharacterized membrane protein YjjP (DUF1212 family)